MAININIETPVSQTIREGVTDYAPSEAAVFDALALKVGASPWVDYSATSTIVGFSSFTAKSIQVLAIPLLKIVVVRFSISGTSDSATTTFTVPNQSGASIATTAMFQRGVNNGTAVSGLCFIPSSSTTISCWRDASGTNWTASGVKSVQGVYIYEID